MSATMITLHPHEDVGWVSWRGGRNFGRIHLVRIGSIWETLCGASVPGTGRIVRNVAAAAINDLCKSCLREYATHH